MILDVTNKMVVNKNTRDWCKLPYLGHPNGCPNYGKTDRCPPIVGMINDIYDLSQQHYFIVKEFDIAEHANKMQTLHPDWSERQLRNCLYWQSKVRIQLDEACRVFIFTLRKDGYCYDLTPEAMGVNVFRTAYLCGLKIDRIPKNVVYKIAFIGALRSKL